MQDSPIQLGCLFYVFFLLSVCLVTSSQVTFQIDLSNSFLSLNFFFLLCGYANQALVPFMKCKNIFENKENGKSMSKEQKEEEEDNVYFYVAVKS